MLLAICYLLLVAIGAANVPSAVAGGLQRLVPDTTALVVFYPGGIPDNSRGSSAPVPVRASGAAPPESMRILYAHAGGVPGPLVYASPAHLRRAGIFGGRDPGGRFAFPPATLRNPSGVKCTGGDAWCR